MIGWDTILKNKEFKGLPYDKREVVARRYFSSYVAPSRTFGELPSDKRRLVKTNFMRTIGPNEDPGSFESAYNGFISSLPLVGSNDRASLLDLGAYAQSKISSDMSGYAAADRIREDMRYERPSKGFLGFTGNVAGSALVGAGAVAAGAMFGGPVALATGAAAALYYAAQNMGVASRIIHNWETEKHEDISPTAEAVTMVGFGVSSAILQMLGMGAIGQRLAKAAPAVLESVGKSLIRANIPEAARLLAFDAGIEGLQEAGEQAIQNALVKINIDPSQAIGQGLLLNFAGGALGGGMAYLPTTALRGRARKVKGLETVSLADIPGMDLYRQGVNRNLALSKEAESNLAGLLPPHTPIVDGTNIALAREAALKESGQLSEEDAFAAKVSKRMFRLATEIEPENVPLVEVIDGVQLGEAAAGRDIQPANNTRQVEVEGSLYNLGENTYTALKAALSAARKIRDPSPRKRKGKLLPNKARFALEEAQAEFQRLWTLDNPQDVTGEGMITFLKNDDPEGLALLGGPTADLGRLPGRRKKVRLQEKKAPRKAPRKAKKKKGPVVRRIPPGMTGAELSLMEKMGLETNYVTETQLEELRKVPVEDLGLGMEDPEVNTADLVSLEDDDAYAEKFLDGEDLPAEGGDMLYQVKGRKEPVDPSVRARLAIPLQQAGILNRVIQTDTQLYNEAGAPVNAALEPISGNLFLSGDVDLSTIGHEGFHRILQMLGTKRPWIQGLLKEFGGIEEAANAVGDYYANRTLPNREASVIKSLGTWMRDMWVAAKADFGMDLTRDELLKAANIQLKAAPTGKARFYPGFQFQTREDVRRVNEYGSEFIGNLNITRNPLVLSEAHRKLLEDYAMKTELDVLSDQELARRANAILKRKGPEGMLRMAQRFTEGKIGLRPEDARAMRIFTGAQLAESIRAGLDQRDLSLREYLEKESEAIFKMAARGSQEAGRILRERGEALRPDILLSYADRIQNEISPEKRNQILKLVEEGNFPAVEKLVRKPRVMDYLRLIYMANLMSSPGTQITNFIGQTLWLGAQLPHRVLMGAVDASFSTKLMQWAIPSLRGRARKHYMWEVFPLLAGFKKRNSQLWRTIKERGIMDPELFGDDTSLIEEETGKAWDAFKASDNKTVRRVGAVLTSPLAMTKTVDLYFKTMAYSGQLEVIAERNFRENGVPHEETLRNPSEEQVAEAVEFARYATFMDRSDPFTKAMVHIRDKGAWPFMPFIITASNLLKRGTEMTPGLGLYRLKGGNVADVIAKQIEGAFLTYLLSAWLFPGDGEDDRLTGDVPEDPAERQAFYAQGKIPYAIRFGDSWISYQKSEPFALPIAMLANLRQTFKKRDERLALEEVGGTPADVLNRRTDDVLSAFGAVGKTILNTIVNTSYFDWTSEATQREGWWKEEPKRVVSNMMPFSSFWRSLRHAMEPLNQEGFPAGLIYGERTIRDANDFLDQMVTTMPFGAFLTESPGKVRLDRFGETVSIPGGALMQWSPVKVSPVAWDSTEMELARLHKRVNFPYPAPPDRRVQFMGQKVTLPKDIYREYLALFGKYTKEAITRVVEAPGYKSLPDVYKARRLSRRMAAYRARANKKLHALLKREYQANRVAFPSSL